MSNRKLKAALEDDAVCRRKFGKPMAKYIRLRIDALSAADNLRDFWPPRSKPERVHELQGKLAGKFSIDVKQPYRLIFQPLSDGQTEFADEQARWQAIRRIEISGDMVALHLSKTFQRVRLATMRDVVTLLDQHGEMRFEVISSNAVVLY